MSQVATELTLASCCAPLSGPALTDDQAGELERVFKALADRHRVKILNTLIAAKGEPVCVCEFTDSLGLKQPTVSYHLKQLSDAGLVEREKRGTFAYFRTTPGAFEDVAALLGVSAKSTARTAA